MLGYTDMMLVPVKYRHTLHSEFGVSKSMIIIDSCVIKSWFTFANLQCVIQTTKAKTLVFCIVFCI